MSETVEFIFDQLDRDHDGVITRDEFAGLMAAAGKLPAGMAATETGAQYEAQGGTGFAPVNSAITYSTVPPTAYAPPPSTTYGSICGTTYQYQPYQMDAGVPGAGPAYTYSASPGVFMEPTAAGLVPTAGVPMAGVPTTGALTIGPPTAGVPTVASQPYSTVATSNGDALFGMMDRNHDGAITRSEFLSMLAEVAQNGGTGGIDGDLAAPQVSQLQYVQNAPGIAGSQVSYPMLPPVGGSAVQPPPSAMTYQPQVYAAAPISATQPGCAIPTGAAYAGNGFGRIQTTPAPVTGDVLQCACGSFFLDDAKFCRKCGTDRSIAEALLAIECDEALFADELATLPGGQDALRWLRKEAGELPQGWEERTDPASGKIFYVNPSTGQSTWDRPGSATRPQALKQIKASIEAAKRRAQQQAQEQKAKAANIVNSAEDARKMATSALVEDKKNEAEHAMLAHLAEKDRQSAAKADAEAARLAALAQKAAQEAAEAQAAWQEAHGHVSRAAGYHAHVTQQANQARQFMNGGQDVAKALPAMQNQVLQQTQMYEAAKIAAAAAAQKARDKAVETSQLEQFAQPGGLAQTLVSVQVQAAKANRAKGLAERARKKAEALKAQVQDIMRDAQYAEAAAVQAEEHATIQVQIANQEAERAKQSAPAPGATSGQFPQMTPEEAQKKLQATRMEVLQAQAEAQAAAQAADQLGKSLQNAQQAAGQMEKQMDVLEAAEGWDEAEAAAALAYQQAKAKADAAAAAAAAAGSHAQKCHSRVGPAQRRVQQQRANAEQATQKERQAWAKRFGQQPAGAQGGPGGCQGGPGGYAALIGTKCGVCGNVFNDDSPVCRFCGQPKSGIKEVDGANTEGQREAARAAQMAAEAALAEQLAAKAEADANKLDMMVTALERTHDLEERLRPSRCECGNTFAEDANFCRNCGRPRMQGWAWDSVDSQRQNTYGDRMTQVRAEAAAARTEVEAYAAQADQPSQQRPAQTIVIGPPPTGSPLMGSRPYGIPPGGSPPTSSAPIGMLPGGSPPTGSAPCVTTWDSGMMASQQPGGSQPGGVPTASPMYASAPVNAVPWNQTVLSTPPMLSQQSAPGAPSVVTILATPQPASLAYSQPAVVTTPQPPTMCGQPVAAAPQQDMSSYIVPAASPRLWVASYGAENVATPQPTTSSCGGPPTATVQQTTSTQSTAIVPTAQPMTSDCATLPVATLTMSYCAAPAAATQQAAPVSVATPQPKTSSCGGPPTATAQQTTSTQSTAIVPTAQPMTSGCGTLPAATLTTSYCTAPAAATQQAAPVSVATPQPTTSPCGAPPITISQQAVATQNAALVPTAQPAMPTSAGSPVFTVQRTLTTQSVPAAATTQPTASYSAVPGTPVQQSASCSVASATMTQPTTSYNVSAAPPVQLSTSCNIAPGPSVQAATLPQGAQSLATARPPTSTYNAPTVTAVEQVMSMYGAPATASVGEPQTSSAVRAPSPQAPLPVSSPSAKAMPTLTSASPEGASMLSVRSEVTQIQSPPSPPQFFSVPAQPTVPTAAVPAQQQAAAMSAFDLVDRNHDGVISREEFAAMLSQQSVQ